MTANSHHDYQNEIYEEEVLESRKINNKLLEDLRQENEKMNVKAKLEPNLFRFIKAYRQYGFKSADLNPLKKDIKKNYMPELDPITYGLDYHAQYCIDGLIFNNEKICMSLTEIESYLKNVYSKNLAIEFEHILNEQEKLWIAKEYESVACQHLNRRERVDLLKLLLKSQIFDEFLGKEFPLFKRFSVQGAESSLAFYEGLFKTSTETGFENLVLGMAHRGRLNLMVLKLGLPPQLLFTKLIGKSEFSEDVKTATGDLSHLFPRAYDLFYNDNRIHLSLLPNPSHLEAVDPVVIGKARSRQMYYKDCYYSDNQNGTSKKVITLLVHGDGAFAGQGVVAETLELSRLPSYSVGGTVHLIIDNQVGFTNPSHLEHSGKYSSDFAKGLECPIVHINGDYPDEVYKAAIFAANYRNRFGKDIIINLICFRQFGHNEFDDPTFTQPIMYKIIKNRKSVPEKYEERLVNDEKLCTKEEISIEFNEFREFLKKCLNEVINKTYKIENRNTFLQEQWSIMERASDEKRTYYNTGFDIDLLKEIGKKSTSTPQNFRVHPKIKNDYFANRLKLIDEEKFDWITGEALAFGSLLLQGYNVRLSGEDVGRGTFSQRHCLLVDQETYEAYIPLNDLSSEQKNFLEVCNSPISEEAVMGFEYGFSLDNPNNLVIWEAQYGDFFNEAQVVIDTYISAAESKWIHQSGIVLLLPHGYDGGGPEHTSCRIERFLQSCSSKENDIDCDNVNMIIAHPTTPANYFHLLRRQMIQSFRKPLIIAAPKSSFFSRKCLSYFEELSSNTSFKAVLDDTTVISKHNVKRVIFVFGKHYYTLVDEKMKRSLIDVSIIRLEELCPFPAVEIKNTFKNYTNAHEFIWAQEEPQNMGAWFFVKPRFHNLFAIDLKYAGRDVSAVPAVGIDTLHSQEANYIISTAFS